MCLSFFVAVILLFFYASHTPKKTYTYSNHTMRPQRSTTSTSSFPVEIFTADNVEMHLAAGWRAEQLTSGKVAVLGAKTYTVHCSRTWTVRDLKLAAVDCLATPAERFSLLRDGRAVTDDEPLFKGNIFLAVLDKKRPTATPATAPPPGSCKLRDPNEFHGSLTQTIAEEEEEKDEGKSTKDHRKAEATPSGRSCGGRVGGGGGGGDVDRRNILRSLALRGHR